MRIGRWIFGAGAALFAVSFWASKDPHTPIEVALLSDRLLEFGAVDFVHGLYDGPEQPLFACVAAGKPLTPAQSVRYRTAYQALLLDKQGLFRRLDANLELRADAGMMQANNIGTQGIAGLHDHHDASAARNLDDIIRNLGAVETAWPLRRAIIANDIYKDLTDLMVHLAPAVHSVGLLLPDPPGSGSEQVAHYTPFYTAMKRAQAAPVNSPAYWDALEMATTAYAQLVLGLQTHIRGQNGAFLHALSGKWLGLQTIAPRLTPDSPSAAARKMDGADAPPCTA